MKRAYRGIEPFPEWLDAWQRDACERLPSARVQALRSLTKMALEILLDVGDDTVEAKERLKDCAANRFDYDAELIARALDAAQRKRRTLHA